MSPVLFVFTPKPPALLSCCASVRLANSTCQFASLTSTELTGFAYHLWRIAAVIASFLHSGPMRTRISVSALRFRR
jgi:hypothetical protein